MSTAVKLYGADWCSQCKIAEQILNKAGVEFQKVDVDADVAASELLINRGLRALPVLTCENDPVAYAGLKGVQEFLNGR